MTEYIINSRIRNLNLTEETEIRAIKNGIMKYRSSISCWKPIDTTVHITKISRNPAVRIEME